MANEKYLTLLRKGVIYWNQWREKNIEIIPDLSCIKRQDVVGSLTEVNFSETNLRGANFKHIDLARATPFSPDDYRKGSRGEENASVILQREGSNHDRFRVN